MALETVVFSQEHLACTAKVAVATHSASPGCGIDVEEFEDRGGVVLQEEVEALALHGVGAATTWDAALCPCSIAPGAVEERWDVQDHSVSPPPVPPALAPESGKAAASASRRRRRRPKAVKNKEEVENQRRNHIAVERYRRRQMNQYLAVLRSVMPPSYAQRASIVAGAINYVKELEQLLQSLEAQKRSVQRPEPLLAPFAGFFTFPHYTTGATGVAGASDNGGDQCAARPTSRWPWRRATRT